MKKILFAAVITALCLTGCATFTITKESLAEQLSENQNIARTNNVASLGTGYYSNNLQKIRCTAKNGKEVFLYSGKNMNFIITKTSTGKTVSMYFDTVYFKNDTLFGLKSRIVGGKRAIPVTDIAKIAIQAETARFEPVTSTME
nr:hypothetical protein [uncultured Flavobacterium sp.]